MTVAQLITILSRCNPDALIVAPLAFQGIEEITSVERKRQGGIGHRLSTQEVETVELQNGNVKHMQSLGLDVEGHCCICGGSGKRPDRICPHCNGTGEPR